MYQGAARYARPAVMCWQHSTAQHSSLTVLTQLGHRDAAFESRTWHHHAQGSGASQPSQRGRQLGLVQRGDAGQRHLQGRPQAE